MKDLETIILEYAKFDDKHNKISDMVFNKAGIIKSLFGSNYPKDAETTISVLTKAGIGHGDIDNIRSAYRVSFKKIADQMGLETISDPSFFGDMRITSEFDKEAFYDNLEKLFKIKLKFHKGMR